MLNKRAVYERFEQNIGLVGKIVAQYQGKVTPVEIEDLMQIGYYYLYLASLRYNEEKGSAFTTFAWGYIQGGIKTYMRTNLSSVYINRQGYINFVQACKSGVPIAASIHNALAVTSLDEPIYPPNAINDAVYLGDILPDGLDWEETIVENVYLEWLLNETLKRLQKSSGETTQDVAKLYFKSLLKGMPLLQRDIANELGLSNQRVNVVINNIREVFKRVYEEGQQKIMQVN